MPVAGGEAQQLTHNSADNFAPQWSPDGRQIAFHSLLKGNRDIYVVDTSGANPTPVTSSLKEELVPVWTPDGQRILYYTYPDSVFEVKRSGSGWGKPRYFRSYGGVFSSDGKQLAVAADSGALCADCPEGLYVMSPDGTGRRYVPTPKLAPVIASPGNAVWSSDSRHLFLAIREKDGTSAIWQIPINGDAERRLVHLKDPDRQFYRSNIDLDSKNFYFPLGDRQSDVWTMELKKKQ